MKRHAALEKGNQYKNKNGNSVFECRDACAGGDAYVLINLNSRWTFIAHIITMYDDGTIEWDYSTGGHFE